MDHAPTMTVPEMMTVIDIKDGGGPPEVLVPITAPVPQPTGDEVLVRVAYAGVNRPDVQQRTGGYPPPPGASIYPGLEISGTVVAAGPEADQSLMGQQVCVLVTGGGYGEYCIASSSLCMPIPKGFDLLQAAALPETYMTVWTNVFQRGGMQPGETLLLHGGSSGIGTTAIQLAKALGGRVITTVGNEEKAKVCRDLGADHVINYKTQDFVEEVKAFTDGKGVELVLDMVGTAYFDRNIECLQLEGRLVIIAFLQPPRGEVSLLPVMLKRLTVTGATLRPRTVQQKEIIVKPLLETVWPLLEAGKVKPIIHSVFPLEEAAEAHALMESSTHIGKIMLKVESR